LIEDYIMESANKLLEELREAQKKKVNLVVWLLTFFILLLFSLIFYLFFTFETPIICRVSFDGQWIRLNPFVSF
jgi:O-antigen/teichoic acid export membrane protein